METCRFYYPVPAVTAVVKWREDHFYDTAAKLTKIRRQDRYVFCGIYDHSSSLLSIGVAKCHKADKFIKKIGRDLAYNNAKTKPCIVIPITKNKVSDSFIKFVKNKEQEIYKYILSELTIS